MTSTPPLGQLLHSFFVDHLITVKGLRPASVRSYRDTIRLLLVFAAADKGCKITRLTSATSPSSGSSDSCDTSKTTAATTPAPATSDSPRCTPCSTTSPRGTPRCSASASGWRPSR